MTQENSRKKILLVTRPIAPPWDEASKNFAFYLAKSIGDLEIHILTHGILPNLPSNIIQEPIYNSNNFNMAQKIRLFWFLIRRKNRFDIIHYLFTPTKQNSFFIKTFAKPNSSTGKTKTIQTVATLREDLFSNKDLKTMFFADLIITYSDYAKNKLRALGLKNTERIYPGIDIDHYQKQAKRSYYLQKYNFSSSDFIINFTGEYTRMDAMDDVIDSFVEISKKIPEARLSLAVRIKNKKDAAKKREVIKILKKNNLFEQVAFHDDGTYDMADIYNLCDISIFPVRNMQGKFDVPLAVIEAMACEKPVIISNLPILQEFAKENNSVKIEKGDLFQLNTQILSLYNGSEKRKMLGLNARKYVEENFDINSVAKQYEEIYNKL